MSEEIHDPMSMTKQAKDVDLCSCAQPLLCPSVILSLCLIHMMLAQKALHENDTQSKQMREGRTIAKKELRSKGWQVEYVLLFLMHGLEYGHLLFKP